MKGSPTLFCGSTSGAQLQRPRATEHTVRLLPFRPNRLSSSFPQFLTSSKQRNLLLSRKWKPETSSFCSLRMDSSNVSVEKLQITNKHGEKLAAVLDNTGSKGVVILSHGFRSCKENDIMLNLTAALTKEGISTCRFDFAGNGESEGQFEFGNYRREVDDLHSVVSYLSQKNFDVIAIVGHSKGGNDVLLYAATYDDVKMILNLSGRFDLKVGVKERFGEELMQNLERDGFVDMKDTRGTYRVTKDSLMDRLSIDMSEEVKKIKEDCRVLTVHGTEDEIIPVQDAYEFAKIILNHKLRIITGANHCYTSHQVELASEVVDFITSS